MELEDSLEGESDAERVYATKRELKPSLRRLGKLWSVKRFED